jgi:hypothetical protein
VWRNKISSKFAEDGPAVVARIRVFNTAPRACQQSQRVHFPSVKGTNCTSMSVATDR